MKDNKYKDRQCYKGICRNADYAIYIAETDRFIYERWKFGNSFLESIGHEDNDDGFDLFEVHTEWTDEHLLKRVMSEEGKQVIELDLKRMNNEKQNPT